MNRITTTIKQIHHHPGPNTPDPTPPTFNKMGQTQSAPASSEQDREAMRSAIKSGGVEAAKTLLQVLACVCVCVCV